VRDHDFGWKNYFIDDTYPIKDLWSHKIIGTTAEKLKAKIPGHDVLLIRLSKLY
jgi:alpha-galactosidase